MLLPLHLNLDVGGGPAATPSEYRLHLGKSVGSASVRDPTMTVGKRLVSEDSNAH